MDNRPIGIFDSGVGGLTVFSEIRKRFPEEDLIYFGDTARVPYGPKSKNTIREYSIQNARFLNSFQVKLIVIACNTSSAFAIDYIKENFNVPIVGVIEPGAEKAVSITKNGKIGIIGTEGTINSLAYPKSIKALNDSITITSRPCPLFVPLVEESWQDHPCSLAIAKEYLNPFSQEHIDTLVLGCTHYPILKQTIQKAVGEKVTLIDSAEAVAEYLDKYLVSKPKEQRAKSKEQGAKGKERFFVSDNEEKFRLIAARILKQEIKNLTRVKLGESWFV